MSADPIEIPADALAVLIENCEKLQEPGSQVNFGELGPSLWLVFKKDFVPPDQNPCYLPSELKFLANKTPEELRKIHRAKKIFPGMIVKE